MFDWERSGVGRYKGIIIYVVMRWAGHVARMGEERGVYRVLVGKPEEKRPLGRPRRRWVDNIRMDLQEVGCGYSKTCLKRNAIVPVFYSSFHRFPFYKGLCFNKTKYVQKI